MNDDAADMVQTELVSTTWRSGTKRVILAALFGATVSLFVGVRLSGADSDELRVVAGLFLVLGALHLLLGLASYGARHRAFEPWRVSCLRALCAGLDLLASLTLYLLPFFLVPLVLLATVRAPEVREQRRTAPDHG